MDLKGFKLELVRRQGETQYIMLEGTGEKNGHGYTFMVMDGTQVPDEEELDEMVKRWNRYEKMEECLDRVSALLAKVQNDGLFDNGDGIISEADYNELCAVVTNYEQQDND